MKDIICTEPVLNLYMLDTYDTSFMCAGGFKIISHFGLVWVRMKWGWVQDGWSMVQSPNRVQTQVMIPSGMAIMRTVTGPRGKVAKVAKVAPKVAREAVLVALVALAKAKQKGEAAVATTGGVTDFKMYISTGAHSFPCPFALVVPISKVLKSGRRLMILFIWIFWNHVWCTTKSWNVLSSVDNVDMWLNPLHK